MLKKESENRHTFSMDSKILKNGLESSVSAWLPLFSFLWRLDGESIWEHWENGFLLFEPLPLTTALVQSWKIFVIFSLFCGFFSDCRFFFRCIFIMSEGFFHFGEPSAILESLKLHKFVSLSKIAAYKFCTGTHYLTITQRNGFWTTSWFPPGQ